MPGTLGLSGRGSAFQQTVPLDAGGEVLELQDIKKRSMFGDCGVRLNPDEAHAFKLELQALYKQYLSLAKNEGEGEWYFLAIGFTPT